MPDGRFYLTSMTSIFDIIVVGEIILLILSFCLPARVEIANGTIFFSVWLFFKKKTKKIEELESYEIKVGMFPIRLQFRDGTVYKWTSFPLGQDKRLRDEFKRSLNEINN